MPVLCNTCSQLGKILWRSQFQQVLLLYCLCFVEAMANIVIPVADPVAQWRERSFWETVVFLQKEAQRKAVPVSMGKLDTRQWLEMQSAALLDIAIAEELPVTRAPPVPDYFWVDSDKRIQCERWVSCMSLRCAVVVRHGS